MQSIHSSAYPSLKLNMVVDSCYLSVHSEYERAHVEVVQMNEYVVEIKNHNFPYITDLCKKDMFNMK